MRLRAAQAKPGGFLFLERLLRFRHDGGAHERGQLLAAHLPFCTEKPANGVRLAAVLANFAA